MLAYLLSTSDEQKQQEKKYQAKQEPMCLVNTYIQGNYWGENELTLMLNLL